MYQNMYESKIHIVYYTLKYLKLKLFRVKYIKVLGFKFTYYNRINKWIFKL